MGAAAITELKIVHASAMRLARGQVHKTPCPVIVVERH
jgi:hypothetical protein